MTAGSMEGRRKVKQSPYTAAHSDRNWSGREAHANACPEGFKAGPSGSGSACAEGLICEDDPHGFDKDELERCGQPTAEPGWQRPDSALKRFEVKFCGMSTDLHRLGSRQEVKRLARMYQRNL